MTGWKIPTMNEDIYLLLKVVIFQLAASYVSSFGGYTKIVWNKVLGWQIAGWPVRNEGMKLYIVVMGIHSLIP